MLSGWLWWMWKSRNQWREMHRAKLCKKYSSCRTSDSEESIFLFASIYKSTWERFTRNLLFINRQMGEGHCKVNLLHPSLTGIQCQHFLSIFLYFCLPGLSVLRIEFMVSCVLPKFQTLSWKATLPRDTLQRSLGLFIEWGLGLDPRAGACCVLAWVWLCGGHLATAGG